MPHVALQEPHGFHLSTYAHFASIVSVNRVPGVPVAATNRCPSESYVHVLLGVFRTAFAHTPVTRVTLTLSAPAPCSAEISSLGAPCATGTVNKRVTPCPKGENVPSSVNCSETPRLMTVALGHVTLHFATAADPVPTVVVPSGHFLHVDDASLYVPRKHGVHVLLINPIPGSQEGVGLGVGFGVGFGVGLGVGFGVGFGVGTSTAAVVAFVAGAAVVAFVAGAAVVAFVAGAAVVAFKAGAAVVALVATAAVVAFKAGAAVVALVATAAVVALVATAAVVALVATAAVVALVATAAVVALVAGAAVVAFVVGAAAVVVEVLTMSRRPS